MKKPSQDIINRVLSGLGTREETDKVVNWFTTDEGQIYLSAQMDKDFLELEANKEDYGNDIPSKKIHNEIVKKIKNRSLRLWTYRAVAVLIPLVFIFTVLYQVNIRVDLLGRAEYNEIFVPKGERLHMVFQDGTKAYLNSETRLRYPTRFSILNRKLFLEGEGYFIVSPNKKRPFVVELENSTIEVTGTSFNVKAYPEEENIYVTLDEGGIRFLTFLNSMKELTAGDHLVFNKKSGNYDVYKSTDKMISSWKDEILSFDNTPLNEVLKRLERWYDVVFVVKNQAIYNYSFTLTAKRTHLDDVLSDLEHVAPIKFNVTKDVIYIDLVRN